MREYVRINMVNKLNRVLLSLFFIYYLLYSEASIHLNCTTDNYNDYNQACRRGSASSCGSAACQEASWARTISVMSATTEA